MNYKMLAAPLFLFLATTSQKAQSKSFSSSTADQQNRHALDMNLVEKVHNKLLDRVVEQDKPIVLIGEEHESLLSFEAHLLLMKKISDRKIEVNKVIFELDHVSLGNLSPQRGPVTYILMDTIKDIFGDVFIAGLNRLYKNSESKKIEEDIMSRCTTDKSKGLILVFTGINHIVGLKDLAQQNGIKNVSAIDHSFARPDNYCGYQQALLMLAQLKCDYTVMPKSDHKFESKMQCNL